MRTNLLYGLDIIRFLAALSVLFYHLGYRAWSDSEDKLNMLLKHPASLTSWSTMTWFGWIGVPVFFVLSGIVIAYSSERANAVKFVVSRITRLAPAMWVVATICAFFAVFEGNSVSSAFYLWLKSITFMPFGPWLIGGVWTLPIEIVFYVLVFLTILYTERRSAILAWPLAIASASFWILAIFTDLENKFPRVTALLLLQHGCHFACGLFIWSASRKAWNSSVIGGLVICLVTGYFQIEQAAIWENPGYGFDKQSIVPYTAYLIAIFSIILSIKFNDAIDIYACRVAPTIRKMGIMTYPLYLLHRHIGVFVVLILFQWGIPAGIAVLAAACASVAAAYFVVTIPEPWVRSRLTAAIENWWPAARRVY